MFRVAPRFETKQIESIFRHKVFKMLISKGKITVSMSSVAPRSNLVTKMPWNGLPPCVSIHNIQGLGSLYLNMENPALWTGQR